MMQMLQGGYVCVIFPGFCKIPADCFIAYAVLFA